MYLHTVVAEGSHTQSAGLDLYVAIANKHSTQRKKRGKHKQKVCTDLLTCCYSEETNRNTRQLCKFFRIPVAKKLQVQSEITESYSKKDRYRKVSRQAKRSTRLVWFLFVNLIVVGFVSQWPNLFRQEKLYCIYDCHIVEQMENLEAFELFESDLQIVKAILTEGVQICNLLFISY